MTVWSGSSFFVSIFDFYCCFGPAADMGIKFCVYVRFCVCFSFLFSMMNLYYINKLSQATYAPLVPVAPPVKTTKKKTSWI